ncbi:MAG: DUF4444 domain-containing protein [Rhizobiaceae bacterium]
MNEPQLPPLFKPERVSGRADPFERACALAVAGSDPGTVVYNIENETLRAAIIFAPESPLEDAMTALPACGVGFQNALGSLAPPEVAVHLEWGGAIRVNGARCAAMNAAASTCEPETEPDWLTVGLEITIRAPDDIPFEDVNYTALFEEGCAEVEPVQLLEAWVRHTLYWINRWTDDGVAPLHSEWRGLAFGLGEDVVIGGKSGTFLGIDEKFGALVRDDETTHLISLTQVLEK